MGARLIAVSGLGPKQPAEIILEAYPDRVYKGYLKQVIPSADRQKGTVKVKVAFLDPDERILQDLSARVHAQSGARVWDQNIVAVLFLAEHFLTGS